MPGTFTRAGLEITVDDWGGVHFELGEDAEDVLSVDPEVMDRVETLRGDVTSGDADD